MEFICSRIAKMIWHRASSDSLCFHFFRCFSWLFSFQVATVLWLLCASHCFAVFVLQDDDAGCFDGLFGDKNALIQGHISVAFCVAAAVLVPIMAFLLERRGPDTRQDLDPQDPASRCGHDEIYPEGNSNKNTPWKFNSSPLKIYHPKRRGSSSNHHFSGANC